MFSNCSIRMRFAFRDQESMVRIWRQLETQNPEPWTRERLIFLYRLRRGEFLAEKMITAAVPAGYISIPSLAWIPFSK